MRIGGRERGEPDQEEDREWVYRNCGGEWVSVCGVRKHFGWVLSSEQIYEAVWQGGHDRV